MKKLVISVLLANLLVACASDKSNVAAVDGKTTSAASSGQQSASAGSAAFAGDMANDPLNDPSSLLAKRSVYYQYDQDAIQNSDKPVVQAHAKYLADHPGRSVRLEGNADERGSNEYNLALGQRRADSVKKMLILGGAREGQVETASYGEEKPVATGHDESAWSQNRRTDLKYVK